MLTAQTLQEILAVNSQGSKVVKGAYDKSIGNIRIKIKIQ